MRQTNEMRTDNSYEKKVTSKTYRFFDLLYKLLVINLSIIILSLPIITLFPVLVGATATLKNDMSENNIFKALFRNIKKYFFKALKFGLCLLIAFAAGIYGYLFWSFQEFNSSNMELVAQIAIIVIVVCLIIFTFIIVHIPLLMITFEKLNNVELLKLSLFLSLRYFITTLIMLFSVIVVLGILFLCMIQPGLLAIWMVFGISLPMFLVIRFTAPIYYKFAKVDFEKINRRIEEELENEE